MCVCLSTWGSRVTITHNALDLTVQAPLAQPITLDMGLLDKDSHTLLPHGHGTSLEKTTTSDILWPPLEACSNLFNLCLCLVAIETLQLTQAGGTHSTGILYSCRSACTMTQWEIEVKTFYLFKLPV